MSRAQDAEQVSAPLEVGVPMQDTRGTDKATLGPAQTALLQQSRRELQLFHLVDQSRLQQQNGQGRTGGQCEEQQKMQNLMRLVGGHEQPQQFPRLAEDSPQFRPCQLGQQPRQQPLAAQSPGLCARADWGVESAGEVPYFAEELKVAGLETMGGKPFNPQGRTRGRQLGGSLQGKEKRFINKSGSEITQAGTGQNALQKKLFLQLQNQAKGPAFDASWSHCDSLCLQTPTVPSNGRPEAASAMHTMKEQLEALQGEDPTCVFVARRINKMGFSSAEILRFHFSLYGPVKDVLVAHSRVKSFQPSSRRRPKAGEHQRLRAAGLAFVVMASADDTARILADGSEHCVNGVNIQLHAFLKKFAEGEIEDPDDDDGLPTGGSRRRWHSPGSDTSNNSQNGRYFMQFPSQDILPTMADLPGRPVGMTTLQSQSC